MHTTIIADNNTGTNGQKVEASCVGSARPNTALHKIS
jgi:hypothetical protein